MNSITIEEAKKKRTEILEVLQHSPADDSSESMLDLLGELSWLNDLIFGYEINKKYERKKK